MLDGTKKNYSLTQQLQFKDLINYLLLLFILLTYFKTPNFFTIICVLCNTFNFNFNIVLFLFYTKQFYIIVYFCMDMLIIKLYYLKSTHHWVGGGGRGQKNGKMF